MFFSLKWQINIELNAKLIINSQVSTQRTEHIILCSGKPGISPFGLTTWKKNEENTGSPCLYWGSWTRQKPSPWVASGPQMVFPPHPRLTHCEKAGCFLVLLDHRGLTRWRGTALFPGVLPSSLSASKLSLNSEHSHLDSSGPREPMLENWPTMGQHSSSGTDGACARRTCSRIKMSATVTAVATGTQVP